MQRCVCSIALCLFLAVWGGSLFTAPAYAAGVLEQGVAEYNAENYDEAIALFKKALKQDPASDTAFLYLGAAYKQIGDYKGAVAVYRDAANRTPPITDAYAELISVLYQTNELNEAKEWIARAEKESVQPSTVAYLKGLVLAKESSNAEAVASFRKAKELDPSLAQQADYQIAMIYVNERRMRAARETLSAIIATDPATEIAHFAREYEEALAKSMSAYKPWHFAVSAAYQYDDNVIAEPLAFISPDFAESVRRGGGRSDSALVNSLRIDYSPLLEGPWYLNAQYSVYSTVYKKINSLNLFTQSLTLTPGYAFHRGAVYLPVSYYHVWLHEREYMGVVSLRPILSMVIAPGHTGQLSAGFSKRELFQSDDPDEDRDANLYSLSAGYLYQFLDGRGAINMRYEFVAEDTDGRNWDNRGNRVTLSVFVPLFRTIDFSVSGDAFLQDYTNTNTSTGPGFPETPKKRRDRTYSGTAVVTWEIMKGLNLNLQYSHTKADSNFAIYEYRRNQYLAGFEYAF
ncbi:MAG: tetratricopeptide repeat protein [Nitrospirota bacterium]